MFAAAAGHFPEVSSTTRWLEPPGVNASSDRLSEACALGRTVCIYIVILTRSAAVASFHSHSIYIIEPNLTEVDVSQVQHLDPNYLYIPWAQIFGRRMYTYISIDIYVYIDIYQLLRSLLGTSFVFCCAWTGIRQAWVHQSLPVGSHGFLPRAAVDRLVMTIYVSRRLSSSDGLC